MSNERNVKKQFWLPMIGAVSLPFIIFGLVVVVAAPQLKERADAPPVGIRSGLFSVKLETSAGAPIAERRVSFIHTPSNLLTSPEDGPTTGTIYSAVSDSAGFASVSVPRTGTLVVEAEGFAERITMPNLDRLDGDTLGLKLVEPAP